MPDLQCGLPNLVYFIHFAGKIICFEIMTETKWSGSGQKNPCLKHIYLFIYFSFQRSQISLLVRNLYDKLFFQCSSQFKSNSFSTGPPPLDAIVIRANE